MFALLYDEDKVQVLRCYKCPVLVVGLEKDLSVSQFGRTVSRSF